MAIKIHGNVIGAPTDTPTWTHDSGLVVVGDLSVAGRVTFALPDDAPTPYGATVRWADLFDRVVLAFPGDPLVPVPPGDWEGGSLVEPLASLVYAAPPPSRLTPNGDHFRLNDQRWWWKGATEFRLAQAIGAGEDVTGLIAQRKRVGANLLSFLLMKTNNTGWSLHPGAAPDYWNRVVRHTCERLAAERLYGEAIIFADTRALMPDRAAQEEFYGHALEVLGAYAEHIVVTGMNEAGHPTQAVDPAWFWPAPRNVWARGSGLTDHDAPRPYGHYAPVHIRRDHPPDARGFTNYDMYEFRARWPSETVLVPTEAIKPWEYGFDPRFAAQMGRHAHVTAGGTFHTGEGVNGQPWPGPTELCARAFYQAME